MSTLTIVLDIAIVITGLPRSSANWAACPAASWMRNAYKLAFGDLLLVGSGGC